MRIFKGIFLLMWGIVLLYFLDPVYTAVTDVIDTLFPDLGLLSSVFINFIPVLPFIIIAIGIFFTLRGNSNAGGE